MLREGCIRTLRGRHVRLSEFLDVSSRARDVFCYSRVSCVKPTSLAYPALPSPFYFHALSFCLLSLFPFEGCLRGHRRHRGNVRVSQDGDTNLPTQEFCEDRFQGEDSIAILRIARSTAVIAKVICYLAENDRIEKSRK